MGERDNIARLHDEQDVVISVTEWNVCRDGYQAKCAEAAILREALEELRQRAEKTEAERDGYAVLLADRERPMYPDESMAGRMDAVDHARRAVDPAAHLARIRAEARKTALLAAAEKADAIGNAGVGRFPMLTASELRAMAEEADHA